MADEEVSFAAEVMKHPGHLHSYVASTHKCNTLGEFLEVKKAIRRYTQIAAWNIWYIWVTSCGEKNLLWPYPLLTSVVEGNLGFVLR